MNGIDEQIQRIEEKVVRLLKEYNSAQKEIQRLQKENNRLSEILQVHQATVSKSGQKEDALKITMESLKTESKKELEKRIDTYLKDIDKCLALLHS